MRDYTQTPHMRFWQDQLAQPDQQYAVQGPLQALANVLSRGVNAWGYKGAVKDSEKKSKEYARAMQQMFGDMTNPDAMVNEIPDDLLKNVQPPNFDYDAASPRTRAATPQEALTRAGNADLSTDMAPMLMQQTLADQRERAAEGRADQRAKKRAMTVAEKLAAGFDANDVVYTDMHGAADVQRAAPGKKRAATPEEIAKAGLRAGTAAQLDERTGALEVLDEPDYLSDTAQRQRLEQAAAGRAPPSPYGVASPGASIFNDQTGQITATAPAAAPKPLPPSIANAETADIESVQLAHNIGADLGGIRRQIETGAIKLGVTNNFAAEARLKLGTGTPEDRNYQTFRGTMEKMRNDSLRLNKGVQTEGDAERAWAELFRSINDPGAVMQRLQEIEAINSRAAQQKMQVIQNRRATYGREPLDEAQFYSAPAVGLPPGVTTEDLQTELARRRGQPQAQNGR